MKKINSKIDSLTKKLDKNATKKLGKKLDKKEDKKTKKSWGGKNKLIQNIKQRQKEKLAKRKQAMKEQLERSGLNLRSEKVTRLIFHSCIIINILVTAYLLIKFPSALETGFAYVGIATLLIWTLVFCLVLFLLWLTFYLFLDLRIFKRRQEIEDVLPDFLQLTSANIRAGMPIDQALWFAVRPRFGVLAKEIEDVAKQTIAGQDLTTALRTFSKKYDSALVDRSINLLIEGLRAGGEVGDLLNRISTNIQETKLMKKEMSANVTTYVIFIGVASILAAPILFGLANGLITIIQQIMSSVDLPTGAATGAPFTVSGSTVKLSDFKIFALSSLIVTSFFSAAIIATIKKGSIKAGLKYIPIFIAVSIFLFLMAARFIGGAFEGFF
ncbi:type II secretion system F family protein [Candidatus Woesearchaeota archaeon]|nr:type II secretion system F family protein [Candidatus Woesearchaeota archaeon]